MKNRLWFLLLIISPIINFSQGIGELVTPSIPFPESIFQGKTGMLYITYSIDKEGHIVSFGISRIDLVIFEKNGKCNPKVIYLDKKYVVLGHDIKTKIGLKYYSKLKPWLKEFGEGTKFIKSPNSDLEKIPPGKTCQMGYNINFGNKWRLEERNKYPKY